MADFAEFDGVLNVQAPSRYHTMLQKTPESSQTRFLIGDPKELSDVF